jgi:DNA-binding NtrC family response regulator
MANILLINGDLKEAGMLQVKLEQMRHEVEVAQNAKCALWLLSHEDLRPDVIIVDTPFNDKVASEFVTELKVLLPLVKIILVGDYDLAQNTPVSSVMHRPLEFTNLITAIG